MYKIFVNDKPFIITAEDVQEPRFAECERVPCMDKKSLMDQVRRTEEMQSKGSVLICDDPEKIFQAFRSNFISIEAGGGIVFNEKQDLLLIKRLGKWDLPKGKIDPGESIQEAAMREVQEECGVSGLKIENGQILSYHTYKLQGHRFLKITSWFKMRCPGVPGLVPQEEESITEAVWQRWKGFNLENLDTYHSIRELLFEVQGESSS